MADVTVKMSGSVTGATTNSIATIDIQDNGEIESILLDLSGGGMDALNDTVRVEISFSSVNSFGVNDVRASIASLKMQQQFLTSGGGASGNSLFLSFPRGIPVNAGERIHMHGLADAGVTMTSECYLYLGTSGRRRTARRNR